MTPEAWFDIEDGEAWLGGAPVLQSLSLQLRMGESTTVLGPNGAGKSSLVKLIDRSLHPIVKPTAHLKLFGSSTVNLWRLRRRLGVVTSELEQRIPAGYPAREVVHAACSAPCASDETRCQAPLNGTTVTDSSNNWICNRSPNNGSGCCRMVRNDGC